MSPPLQTSSPSKSSSSIAAAAAASTGVAALAAVAASPPAFVAAAAVTTLLLLRLLSRATVGHLPEVQLPEKRAESNNTSDIVDDDVGAPVVCLETVLSRVPSLRSPLLAPAALVATPLGAGGHAETIFAAKARVAPGVAYERELLRTPDGGTVALDTLVESGGKSLQGGDDYPPLSPESPVLVVLPGLTGGSHDAYVQHLAASARRAGFRPVVFNSRGTSGSPVTTPQFYSASFVGDLDLVVRRLSSRHPTAPLVAAGYSLGANILVNYLGGFGEGEGEERGSGLNREGSSSPSSSNSSRHLIAAAVSMANPFDLALSDANFERGFNRVYDFNLARSLRTIFAEHAHLWEQDGKGGGGLFDPQRAKAAKTIRDFDDAITRVSFGWPSVDAYYAGSSSALRVAGVRCPLLCLQALDDPIAPAQAIPRESMRGNKNVVLATTRTGGHLGWCCAAASARVGREEENGGRLFTGAPWCDAPAVEFLSSVLEQLREDEGGKKEGRRTGGAAAEVEVEAKRTTAKAM